MEGYSYRATVELSLPAPTRDIADEPPGFASMVFDGEGTLNLVGTDPGRTPPLDAYALLVAGLFPADGPVCNSPAEFHNSLSGFGYALSSFDRYSLPAGQFCSVVFLDGPRSLPWFGGVPESEFDALAEALRNPPVWALMTADSDLRNVAGTRCVLQEGDLTTEARIILDSAPQQISC
jgi:hypothetical protein